MRKFARMVLFWFGLPGPKTPPSMCPFHVGCAWQPPTQPPGAEEGPDGTWYISGGIIEPTFSVTAHKNKGAWK